MKPYLYIFSGLPGSGKTSLAKELAKEIKACYFRLDTLEQGLRDLCNIDVQGEGYRLSYRLIADNLDLGNSVIADCCNPFRFVRKEWEALARKHHAEYLNLEIHCSNKTEHKKRLETRINDIEGLVLPAWEEVQSRIYETWDTEVLRIDTSKKSLEDSLRELIQKIDQAKECP